MPKDLSIIEKSGAISGILPKKNATIKEKKRR
jgi:hypothetical protein